MTGKPDRYNALMLVTYRIRPDANEDEYEAWLRRVDNPFFNASPLAERYVNWKISGGAPVFAPNTYFDLWDMSDTDRFGPVRNDAALNVFRAEWHRLWGLDGEGQAGQMQGLLLERVAAAPQTRSMYLALLPAADAMPRPDWQAWRVAQHFRGPPPAAPFFHTRFARDAADAAQLARAHSGAVLAHIVAAPAD